MQPAAGPRPFRERLRRDANLYLELDFCATGPIPHSVFLDWSPDDRAKALSHFIESKLRCTMCGTAEWEWNQDRFAYEPVLHVCRGCEMREAEQKEMESRPGHTIRLAPSKGSEAEERRRVRDALAQRDAEDAELDEDDESYYE